GASPRSDGIHRVVRRDRDHGESTLVSHTILGDLRIWNVVPSGDVVAAGRREAEVSSGRSSRGADRGPGRGPAPAAPLGPGKQTLTSQLDAAIVQQRAAARAPEADVHAAAAHGTAGSATAL